jgi:23S rRNA C2498 (ribose-2'-O)-methylase RlmM
MDEGPIRRAIVSLRLPRKKRDQEVDSSVGWKNVNVRTTRRKFALDFRTQAAHHRHSTLAGQVPCLPGKAAAYWPQYDEKRK